jgi:hypothetical protein
LASRAQEVLSDEALEAIASSGPSTAVAVDRSWLYNDPARVIAPGRAVALARVTYGSGSPTRAFAGNTGTSGALLEVGGEFGLVERLSAVVIGAQGEDAAGSARTGAMVGLRWSALPLSMRGTQLVLSGGLIRELQGQSGAWARLTAGHDEGRARLALSVHGERMFASTRDTLDVMVTAGATLRLTELIRAGVEYVGQDLEGMLGDNEAEGGARHVLGPVVSAALWSQRVSLVGGPAVALGAGQGRLLGRLALACQF